MPVNRDYKCPDCGKIEEHRTEPRTVVRCSKCKIKMKITYTSVRFFMNEARDSINRTINKYGKDGHVDPKTGKSLVRDRGVPYYKNGRRVN